MHGHPDIWDRPLSCVAGVGIQFSCAGGPVGAPARRQVEPFHRAHLFEMDLRHSPLDDAITFRNDAAHPARRPEPVTGSATAPPA